MRVTIVSLFTAILLLAWTTPAAAVGYCEPEYQSCDGAGTPGGTWGGGGTTSGTRDGIKEYGAPYSQCYTGGGRGGKCWECGFNPYKQTDTCIGVYHSGSCQCTEKISNYIIIECGTYGVCEYYEI